ncbi:putative mucin/carbohydrate-binding domain-containing protein [Bacillus cereus]|uniref:putative mucin/carbohydrate-binding domain-containing protein n=1 Tax=Bacillus cereus TaxID=1396 RepID=UPI0024055AC4|nr:putative mucin/carbohydrate-binding domain-containing protein [Bacillus cereus]MDF9484575.1 putative mucin/carbohydrate-binding domain-containing protein [Bacillus cereus]MDF9654022.1 putative mucin/carbohydrate-binding domain-containing protein [Bacillus cereus]WIV92630.1 putative mucin/carbohydrate-binding domain-containing protein [Bacillus bombysepticus]
MSKKKKSRVLVAGICISTLLSPVAFEASKGYAAPLEENKGGNLEEVKENKFEQTVFQLPGKGNVEEERERLKQKWNLSANEPTGIYAKPNEEITIEIQGKESIKAFIGTRSYDVEGFKEFDLKPGKNVIKSPNGGILYFYNLNDSGEVTAKVEKGGSHFPLFILGKHTKTDWDEMLEKYKNPYAVELKGERSLVTASYDAVKKHMGDTDPVELMKLHDKIIRMENSVAGLSEDGMGVAKSPSHYVQFVEKRIPEKRDHMFATDYHTGYVPDVMNKILNTEELTKDGWGPWHEVGHLHQQEPWQWTGMGETTVNIYSLAVQTALGNKSRMEVDGRYEKAFAYLNQPDEKKDFDKSDPLIMFWQLQLIYGDQFYPRLHQMYRVMSDADYPLLDSDQVITDREKKQLFIYMASKVSGQNLIPYFAKWGLHAESYTVEKVDKLQLPEPKNEIWLSRDNAPIREKQVKPYKVPYGEAVNTVPDVVIGTGSGEELDEKKASELVQNLGENVKVSGEIRWSKQETGKQIVYVEIIDENENVNSIPVSVNGVYGDSMLFKTYWNTNSVLTLQHKEKKFNTTLVRNILEHSYRNQKYIGVTIYDANGNEKKSVSAEGHEGLKNFVKELDGMSFEYGDMIKVYHIQPQYLEWYDDNKLVDQGEAKKKKEKLFKITPQGYELIDGLQEVTAVPQKVVVGTAVEKLHAKDFVQVKDGEVIGFVEKPNTTKIGEQKVKVETKDRFGNKKVTEVPVEVIYGDSIMFFGTWHGGTNIKSIVTLNHEEKKFSTTDSEGPMHTSFADEKYMEMTVYDKGGKEKKVVSVKASENTKAFAEQFNGMTFEYGDVVKVYQREFDRFKVYKKNEFVDTQYGVHEVFFKVTEQGFERMAAQQEVKAMSQKVVIGTDSEKLDARNFVEVKDGEVIGFVEKPNTTKIGEQKVKVETKDRLGNKKVTEVPLEIIYGDSIMFFGTWHGGSNIKSVVTLNHEEKKFSTTDSEGPMHTSFADEKYMGMTVYDKDGKEKKALSVRASENTKVFAEQFNGMTFEYGDVVKVYQREFDRFKVYKKNELVDTQYGVHEVSFKVTEQGFERMEARQEVTAIPQKVVIGKNADKLDAKNFVQVKDGEVIGFVEKPNTTKIGKQTVKVETKDRFGNKKVTEVPVEVTYGDSIVYQGLSNVVRSIVTFNHEDKKLHVTHTNEQIHSYFKNELYMGITLYDQNGTEKKHVTAEGQETSKNFAEQVNGTSFQYGDVVKVYHAESDRLNWYKKSELVGKGDKKKFKEISFKVTPNGLEQV